MAKISKTPKIGEFLILRTDRTEVDLQVTNVNVRSMMDGHSTISIEGFPHRERGISGMANQSSGVHSGNISMNDPFHGSFTYPANGIGNYSIPAFTTISSQPMDTTIKFTKTPGKGMDVDINTIETVDGTKAQIVLYAGSKKVIAWESEAFEDDEDLSVKGAQTADVKAKKAAEGQAKKVLKAVFSQS